MVTVSVGRYKKSIIGSHTFINFHLVFAVKSTE